MARISTVDRLTALRAELAGAGVDADKLSVIDRQIVAARGVLFGEVTLEKDGNKVTGVTINFTRAGTARAYTLLHHGDAAALVNALRAAADTLAATITATETEKAGE